MLMEGDERSERLVWLGLKPIVRFYDKKSKRLTSINLLLGNQTS